MTTLTDQSAHLATINEIMLGYYLNKEKWYDDKAKKIYNDKITKVDAQELADSIGRAEVMAKETLEWARRKGYSTVKKVFWTGLGNLQDAVDPTGKIKINPKDNPTDTLVKFVKGPANGFLGISAKATRKNADIGFKNPGLGTIEEVLGLNLYKILDSYIAKAIKLYNLSENTNVRKTQIRANRKTQEKTQELGSKAMSDVIDTIIDRMKKMKQDDLKKYILKEWMNSADVIYPPYIKVTGKGAKAPFTAKVEDPLANEKLAAINSNKVTFQKAGNETILIMAGTKHIMKMRAKFESEKLASSFKFSGDPWS